ncbi:class I SAM-dependent methyltransferase [Gorillibacterium sp. sgz5001074]|uniref:class I SAM-dependent methyltransferase n=1 Tax=Gorillibacterium sp. sgz5001074 TaxID=3446695 RepID=UPI003F67C3BE
MDKLKELAERLCGEGKLVQAVLSGPRSKTPEAPSKIKIKPLLLKGDRVYQFERTVGAKVFHENVAPEEAGSRLADWLAGAFKQGLLQTAEADYQVLVDKKGKVSILERGATKQEAELTHNRKKHYVLEEGTPVPFLVELGVMNAQGKVLAQKYDKFRQINRYLEMIGDIVPHLKKDRKLRIVDFGCGKSYLTFALYHYLVYIRKLDVEIIGLDLKEDVITHCSALAGQFGYAGLRFQAGDIQDYRDEQPADMVVTLHACDTATDAALEKAVRWNADVILSVPCCQHELNRQIKSETLSPMLNHGIIKERLAALATDSIRAHLLELVGYKTQLLEFIDMEHTPKNLLIRAVRQTSAPSPKQQEKLSEAYKTFKQFLHADPYLERALQDKLAPILGTPAGRE